MALLLLLTLFSSIGLVTQASAVKCGGASLEIMYPFHVNGPEDCSGFELSCRENTTMIHFPGYGELVVKSISYDTKRVDLLDPKSCVHGVFLKLNLSLTPFRYYYVVKNYTYLNCSATLSPSLDEVSCLSGSGHHVYTVDPSSPVPDSCRPLKTVAIPFSFSPYLADNSFGLSLTWDMPGRGDHHSHRDACKPSCQPKNREVPVGERLMLTDSDKNQSSLISFKTKWVATGLGISIFILAVAVLLRIEMQKPKKVMEKEKQLESEKLLAQSV